MALVVSLAGTASAACEPHWTSLRLTASKALILSGEVNISARAEAAETAAADLRECPDGAAKQAAGDCVVVLDATTKATLHFSQEITWIDPADQGVLQTLAARRARRLRTIRATEDGHHQWTSRPEDKKESKRPVDRWTRRSEEHVTWPEGLEAHPRSSSFGLLYQVAALRLDREGAVAKLHAHSKGRLLEISLEAQELVPLDVDYERTRAGATERVDGRRELRRVLVSGDAADGKDEESPVGLLGMSSGIELFLEPGTGLPIEVRGKVPKIGELRVRLAEASLP